MKLTILLLMLGISGIFATGGYSQETLVNLSFKDASINQVLAEIEKQSEFRFFFNQEQINTERRIDLTANKVKISQVLKDLFAGTDVAYEMIENHIVLVSKKSLINQIKQIVITGKVTDNQNNEPLPGVNIQVKGTKSGTITDFNGKYSIEVLDPNSTLIFTYLGYATQEIALAGKNLIDVSMEVSSENLNEVVVTALGIKREEKALGFAVQKVDGEGLQKVKTLDVGTSLTGKVAGLLVKNSTEFSAEPDIQIRGEKPILVIDGVPYGNMSLRDLPSDDIESISVLKGATASALYGYRGASGAIMVTTKRGSAKKGMTITVNSSNMFSAGYLAIPESQSTYGREVNTATNTTVTNGDGSWGPPLEGQSVIQWDPISKTYKSMPYLPVGKDNFKNFIEQGYVLNNNVNLVQQGENGSFRVSATSVQNKGQYPNSMFSKYTYGIGGDMKLNKFTLTSNISFNKQVSPNVGFGGYTGYDPMYSMLIWTSPDVNILDLKDYWQVPNETQNNSYTDTNNNPYFDRNERTHSLNKDVFNVSLSIVYDIASWLKATIRSGYDTYSNRQVIQVSKGSLISAGAATVIDNGSQVWGESMKGSFNIGLGRGYSFNNDFILSGEHTFGNFSVDAFAGGTIFTRQDEGTDSRTQGGLSIPAFYSLEASVLPASVSSSLYRQQVNSLYGRLALSWNKLVYVEGTLRNDWSSTLSESTRSYLYPSVSGSFIVSELLPKIEWLSLWKLRGSWTSSKTPADIYSINRVYSLNNPAWGNLSSASVPTTIYGSNVFPESASTWEVGTAVNLYKNRASVDVSYYNKRMYDFLRATDISPATGYYSNYINIDEEITRKGIEVTLNGTPIKTNDWQWDVSVNWSKYARYYTKLDSLFSEDQPWVKVGERYDAFVLYDFQYDKDHNIIHNNGVPMYSAYPSKFGNSDPDWIWGVNTSVRYKNWNFSMSVDGRMGGLAQTTTEMYMWRSGSHPNSVTPERYLDATQPGTKNYTGYGVKVYSGSATYDTYGNIITDDRILVPNNVPVTYETYVNALHKGTAWGGAPSPLEAYSTTFLKIREISVTYDLPANICSKFKSQGVSVSAIAQNVFLWAKQFKYSDPDGGYENFSDPSIRYIGFNLKFIF